MELLFLLNLAKDSGVRKVIAVIPYFSYSRQDHNVTGKWVPVELILKLLKSAGADEVLTVDLHSPRLISSPIIPICNLSVADLFANHILKNSNAKRVSDDLVLVAPDFGAIERTRTISAKLNLPMAVMEKTRLSNGQYHMILHGGVVRNKYCVIIDDMIDGGGTICKAAEILTGEGALRVEAYVTHPVFAYAKVLQVLKKSLLKNIYVTDTISTNHLKLPGKIKVLRVESVIASRLAEM